MFQVKENGKYVIYTMNGFISIFSLLKLKVFFDSIEYFSYYTSMRGQRIADMFGGFKIFNFGLKSMLRAHSIASTIVLFFSSMIIYGYILRIFEK